MSKNTFKVLRPLMLSFIVVGCATKSSSYRQNVEKYGSPTSQIKHFKIDTAKRTLDEVIADKKVNKQEVLFLSKADPKLVNKWLNYFSGSGKHGFEIFLNNGEKYKPIIEKIFAEHNLPKELFYVGLIESGYKTKARSHKSAVGPWQFIKGTALRYGLKVNRAIDERQNIYKSTKAAALYFQDLYNIFGSWELALSAYNAGEYGIIRRIRGANTRDYYELSKRKVLPKETRNYVPKVIAAMAISKARDEHNIKVKRITSNKFLNTKEHKIKGPLHVGKLARKLNLKKSFIIELNQGIKQDYIPYQGRTGYTIILPANKSLSTNYKSYRPSKVERRIAKASSRSRMHKVKKNETLYAISKRYNIKISSLKRINNLRSNNIYSGQNLRLDSGSQPKRVYAKNIKHYYKVKSGDHLSRIAHIFQTTTSKLKKLNNMKSSKLLVGQKVIVPAHEKKIHTVKKGDALLKIARKYKTSLPKIKELNQLKNGQIYPGQEILISFVTK